MIASEFELIDEYFTWPQSDDDVELGIGDDAAVLKTNGSLVACADTLVAGVHFSEDMSPEAIGWKALAVNLSDCAAMGARPRWFTLCLSLPDIDTHWLQGFSAGLRRCAEAFGVSLVGGDTTRGPLSITINAFGDLSSDGVLCRSTAQIGQLIGVTGSLGRAAYCLNRWRITQTHPSDDNRLWWPEPRIEEGQLLAGIASAAIDVSDGLMGDLLHVLKQSQVAAQIHVDRLPLGEQASLEQGLAGGEDYELVFTLDVKQLPYLTQQWASRSLAPFTIIGEIVPWDARCDSDRLQLCRDGVPIQPGFAEGQSADGEGCGHAYGKGYDHFS